MTPYNPPPFKGVDVLYQDNQVLAVAKPSGLLSVPGKGEEKQDCLISRVQTEFPQARIVHRLDLGTSGVMIMALDHHNQGQLGKLFQQRAVHKSYQAIINGKLRPSLGEIELPLITDWPNRPRQKVDHITGKASHTRYRLMSYDVKMDASRVELFPKTGRSHQLRVHMQAIGHPILGDELYAHTEAYQKAKRLLLHAAWIGFPHPVSGQHLSIKAELPF